MYAIEGGIIRPIVDPAIAPLERDLLYPRLINVGKITAAIAPVVPTLEPETAQKKPPINIVATSEAEAKRPANNSSNEKTFSRTLPLSNIIPPKIKSGKQVKENLFTAL